MMDSTAIDAPPVHRTLTSFYAWMCLIACIAIGMALFAAPDLRIASGLAAGSLAGLVMVGSWHWMLTRPRWWALYIVVFFLKYALIFGGLFLLCTRGFADPVAVAGGGVLPVVAAILLAGQIAGGKDPL